jgi:hypothetical protein
MKLTLEVNTNLVTSLYLYRLHQAAPVGSAHMMVHRRNSWYIPVYKNSKYLDQSEMYMFSDIIKGSWGLSS